MYSEVAWELVSSGTQVQPQIIPEPGSLPDCLSVFYDYDIYKDPWQGLYRLNQYTIFISTISK